MPPQPLFDISKIDENNIVYDHDAIYKINPQRFEFMLLDAVIHLDKETNEMAGYHDLREDEFWVRGHIPGRPVFPGVLMLETAAQLLSFYTTLLNPAGFLGFGAVNEVKFRRSVTVGQRVVILGKMLEIRSRRCIGKTQAYADGKLVYEGLITGVWV